MAIRILLSRDGVGPNSKRMFGLTLLIVVAENWNVAVVELLLGRHNIDPDPKDD